MARVLGAELYEVNPGRWRLPAAVRYPIQAARTLARVIAKRPRNVIVANPPFRRGTVAVSLRPPAWLPCLGRRWLLGAFNDPRWTRFSMLNYWVLRHSCGVIPGH